MADKTTPGLEEVVDDLVQVRIVFIGESHGSPEHHRAQLRIIQALKEKGKKLAVGLEMFQSESQEVLDQWTAGKLKAREFKAAFEENWKYWDLYREIFHYAQNQDIPLVGLNVDRSIIRQVARGGLASLRKEQLEKLPVTSCNVSPAYEQYIRRALGGHIKDVPFKNFCEAQLLWDMSMAENLVRFMRENPEYTVVVLAGEGHSWKHAIPAQVEKKADYTYRVLLPKEIGLSRKNKFTEDDADYLLLGLEVAPLH